DDDRRRLAVRAVQARMAAAGAGTATAARLPEVQEPVLELTAHPPKGHGGVNCRLSSGPNGSRTRRTPGLRELAANLLGPTRDGWLVDCLVGSLTDHPPWPSATDAAGLRRRLRSISALRCPLLVREVDGRRCSH